MKSDIHPEYKVTKVSCGCGNAFETRSTRDVIRVEICSNCHPFYTGKQKFVDTAGMVEKFKRKWGTLEDRKKAKEEEEAKKIAARKQPRKMRQAVIPASLKSLPEQNKPAAEAPAAPEQAAPPPAPQPAPEPAPPAPAPEAAPEAPPATAEQQKPDSANS